MSRIIGYVTTSKYITDDSKQMQHILEVYPNATFICTSLLESWQYANKDLISDFTEFFHAGDIAVFDSIVNFGLEIDVVINRYFAFVDKQIHLMFLQESFLNTDNISNSLEDMKLKVTKVFTEKMDILEKKRANEVLGREVYKFTNL